MAGSVCGPKKLRGRGRGDLIIVPDTSHSLEAMDKAAVLLTVAKLA
jgi:hypothetical protein